MADELIKVNTLAYTGAAVKLNKAAPKMLRAVKKQMREESRALGKAMTAALAETPGGYPGGLGDRLRRNNYTKLRFLRDNSGVQMVLRLAVRHPVYGNREVWVNQVLAEGTSAQAFDKGVDKLQNDIANATTKALKESLK